MQAIILRTGLLLALLLAPVVSAQDSTKAFVNFRLIDGSGAPPLEQAVMIVQGGRITAVGSASSVPAPGSGVQSIDLGGRTVMPGMVNAHGHVANDTTDKLAILARYGVTTVLSLGGEDASHAALRDAQDPLAPNGARLLVAGPVQEHQRVDAAQAGIERLQDMRVDWVKARVQNGSMPQPVYAALIEAAHAGGLKVAAHMYTLADTKGLLRAGVDVLAHSVRDREVDAELLALVSGTAVCLTPTLTRELSTFVYAERPDFLDDPFLRRGFGADLVGQLSAPALQRRVAAGAERGRSDLAMAQRNLKILHDAGLRVALGTDSGASVDRIPGYFEHLELELMQEAGLAPMDIIVAATGNAAACMDMEDVGTLTPGKWADFIVLDADPLLDVRNTRSIESVWLAGERFVD